MKQFDYSNDKTSKISFPIGGIGTGCIGLAGNGRFIDMEIGNRPNKGSHSGFTHFAVKVEDEEKVLDAKVINSDRELDYIGGFEKPKYQGFGFGPDRADMTGVPHFRESRFNGEFPMASIDFIDESFPGQLTMKAFNPFIPTNEDDSSIPGAFFEFEIMNDQDRELTYSIALSCNNFYANQNKDNAHHTVVKKHGKTMMHLSSDCNRETTEYGDMTMVCDANQVSYQRYWFRGSWFDNLATYWQDFTAYGPLKDRVYEEHKEVTIDYSADDIATLVAHLKVKSGGKKSVRFVLSWSMPLMSNHWEITNPELSEDEKKQLRKKSWKNYYATIYDTSMDSALYSIDNFDRLLSETLNFKNILFGSSLPQVAIDAISSTMSVLKSPTCLRLTDGSFYGFEGVHPHEGSCEGTCTHVWSYTYAMAFLFPWLERSARTIEYTHSIQESGGMAFRVQLPIEATKVSSFRACVDGQFGTVMRVYREFLISGDRDWLRNIWPNVKKSIEYAWSEENIDQWDKEKVGIMDGRQHHTLDMELFGPSSWLSSMYLGGLMAGAKLAKILGEQNTYDDYMAIVNKGIKSLNSDLFNGEYFIQSLDLSDKNQILKYDDESGQSLFNQSVEDAYWNSEQNEIKYQIGEGCSIDQILGQWHADLLNLGSIIDDHKVESALQSIYKYNYKADMYNHFNPCRIYSLNDEGGLIMCAYPEMSSKPFIPVPYAEETMHGFEYQAASHMIKRGLEEQGLRCVKSIRDKYDGEKRNPWNEYECGSNYARSMASYALLLVYSGFRFDMNEYMIGFNPVNYSKNEKYTFFWSLDSGWGSVEIDDNETRLNVAYGNLKLSRMELPYLINKPEVKILLRALKCSARIGDGHIIFDELLDLDTNDTIKIQY